MKAAKPLNNAALENMRKGQRLRRQREKLREQTSAFVELPDELREPLHSLQADLDWLLARYEDADDELRALLKDSIRNRLSQIEEASYGLAQRSTADIALWMIERSYATGHGDTIPDILNELEAQIRERFP